MLVESVDIEIRCEISSAVQCRILREHFALFYQILAESELIQDAHFDQIPDMYRCLSGIPMPYYNVVMGVPQEEGWDQCIDAQILHFGEHKVPFIWYFDENTKEEFKEKLLERGFVDGGVLRGVIGMLDEAVLVPEPGGDITLHLVEDVDEMEEFSSVVSAVFGLKGESKELYKQAMWDAANRENLQMCHWICRKGDKVVSAISTLIHDGVVSFWNGASLPEVRCQGLNMALRSFALRDALSKGCYMGSSYLMSDGMAFGICEKLGYHTKWRFSAYVAPKD